MLLSNGVGQKWHQKSFGATSDQKDEKWRHATSDQKDFILHPMKVIHASDQKDNHSNFQINQIPSDFLRNC